MKLAYIRLIDYIECVVSSYYSSYQFIEYFNATTYYSQYS